MFAPKGTPKEIVTKLNAALDAALKDPATRKRLEDLGGVIPKEGAERTSEWLGEFVASEVKKWGEIIQAGGVVAQ
jgi:tripartite-type tricarboxylate transporter receptor subunit TctC